MILLELFLVFVQIGALAFGGGYAVLPLIQKLVVEDRGWLSTAEMTDLFGEKAVAMDNLVPVALITFVIGFIISLKSKTDVIHKIIIGGVIGIVLNTAITNFL